MFRIDRANSYSQVATKLRVALHGHFYYADLISDFMEKLEYNTSAFDLFLTTDTHEKAALLDTSHKGLLHWECTCYIVPNRGRDIGAFLAGITDNLQNYDVVGHVHAKRSLALGVRCLARGGGNFSGKILLVANIP